jgi:glycerol kinase
MASPCILALDQSTSATKALLFAADGMLIDKESLEHRQYYPQPGWVEHDAEEIWQNTLRALRALLARQTGQVSSLIGLSIANQRETIVVFERGSGRPLHRAIVWQCRRSAEICAEHIAAGEDEFVHARTGLKIDPYFSGSKLQWLVRAHPELRRRLENGDALIGTIDAYLVYRLTSGAVFATDSTNASRTLLYNIADLRWDPDLCELWNVPIAALPEVRDSFSTFGETTCGAVLPRSIPICGVMGDSQAALLAQRCFQAGAAKVTFGTGSSILLNVGSTLRLSSEGVLTALAWTHRGVPVYAFEGIIISSASTLTWLRDQLRLVDDLHDVEALASEISDNGGVYLVPAFSGLGLPYWAPDARASIVGLSAHSDRRHVVRAALESISYQIGDALEAMRAEAGVAVQAVHADGGPTANRFLMQFTADVTGTALRVASTSDGSALGAAFAGLLGSGVCASFDELVRIGQTAVVYEPSGEPARIAANLEGWRFAVRQTLLSAKTSETLSHP